MIFQPIKWNACVYDPHFINKNRFKIRAIKYQIWFSIKDTTLSYCLRIKLWKLEYV